MNTIKKIKLVIQLLPFVLLIIAQPSFGQAKSNKKIDDFCISR
jgi:hypothetical protein